MNNFRAIIEIKRTDRMNERTKSWFVFVKKYMK